jgi:hypothetical protein
MRLTPEQRTEILERHLRDHGHIDHQSIDDAVADATAGNGPSAALGARIVARAWVDPEFRYPSGILGNPPTWYKSFEYRSRVVREPRAVLAEFGMELEPGIEIRVHDSTAEQRYLVLPLRPDGTDGWDVDALAALVTRNSMIGTGRPLPP